MSGAAFGLPGGHGAEGLGHGDRAAGSNPSGDPSPAQQDD
jgi:hypothetical protein